jgi:AcrR family transcriptional regulator
MGIVQQRRRAETRALLIEAGLQVLAERGLDLASLDDVAAAAGFTKGAIYRQFPSKGAFVLALFEQYAAVAAPGRKTPRRVVVPLTLQFAAQAMRDPLLRRRLAVAVGCRMGHPEVGCSRPGGCCPARNRNPGNP